MEKKYLYAAEPFIWRKGQTGNWDEHEYPIGTKVEIIGSGPRGFDVKIVETGVEMLETGSMKWSETPIKKSVENKFKPFDLVIYKPTGERGLVKSCNGDNTFVLFKIQSTAQCCKTSDLELE